MKTTLGRFVLATFLLLAVTLASPRAARADDTIKHPGDHPNYVIEVEPHGVLGWGVYGGSFGIGVGGRLSIPVMKNGFIPKINNSVAVSFGIDYAYYSGCYYTFTGFANGGCGASYLFFPATLQWNFFVAQKWSVFGEPGFAIYHGFFDTNYPCVDPRTGVTVLCSNGMNSTGVYPAFYVGGRYHFTEHVALTMRLGYPTLLSVGVSFM